MLFSPISIKSYYRNSRCKNQNWRYQKQWHGNSLVIADVNLIAREFQKHEYFLKNHFVDKTIILKQAAAILKENANTFAEKTSDYQPCPGHQPLINLAKILEDQPRLFWAFIGVLYPLKILISGASDSTNLLLMSFSKDLFFAVLMGSSLL